MIHHRETFFFSRVQIFSYSISNRCSPTYELTLAFKRLIAVGLMFTYLKKFPAGFVSCNGFGWGRSGQKMLEAFLRKHEKNDSSVFCE